MPAYEHARDGDHLLEIYEFMNSYIGAEIVQVLTLWSFHIQNMLETVNEDATLPAKFVPLSFITSPALVF